MIANPAPLNQIPELDAIEADPDAEILIVADAAMRDLIQPVLLNKFVVAHIPNRPAETDLSPLVSRSVVIFSHPYSRVLQDYLPDATLLQTYAGPSDPEHIKTHIAIDRERQRTTIELVRRAIPLEPVSPEEPPPPEEPIHPGNDISPADAITSNWPFKFLGYNQGSYFYLPNETQQIIQLTGPEHTRANLLVLCSADWWASTFPGRQGTDWGGAANILLRNSARTGLFTGSIMRGRGCWLDTDAANPTRIVFHAGDRLIIGREHHAIAGFPSHYVYQRAEAVSTDSEPPASAAEAIKFLRACNLMGWTTPLAGTLLAGWCCAATVCGALKWRPHIWLLAESGSGKSWALTNLIMPFLGSFALFIQGASTEAGIRQKLLLDARPVILDECESEDEKGKSRVKAVIDLARQSSTETGGMIVKGTVTGSAMEFNIRSAFCFSSTGFAPTQKADLSRITKLCMAPLADEDPRRLECRTLTADTLLNPSWCASVRNRIMSQVVQIRANAATFADAISRMLSDRRMGDQFGTMIAAAHALSSSKIVSAEEAKAWVTSKDWSEFVTTEVDKDQNLALSILLNAHVRVESSSGPETTSVEALIDHYFKATSSAGDKADAHDALLLIGVKITDNGVYVHNTHQQLARIFKDSPWSGKWKDQLSRIKGATHLSSFRFGLDRSRCVMLPLSAFDLHIPSGGSGNSSIQPEENSEDLPF